MTTTLIRTTVALVCLLAQFTWAQAKVTVSRLPGGGMQPQAAVDVRGVAHLIYLGGDPAHCDVFYIKSRDDGATWSAPMKVNSRDGSAIAIGTVRGAHLALGRNGRVHVAWMGSAGALPRSTGKLAPMLYARLREDGSGFEPQRNLIVNHPGVDGGGSIAADDSGNVYVGWHAPEAFPGNEQSRRVWVAHSTDDGKTFDPETALSDPATGACGCCGMRMTAAAGKLFVLYRGAAEMTHRGMYLIDVRPDLQQPHTREIAPMEAGICIMSTAALASGHGSVAAAWETNGQVQWEAISASDTVAHVPDLPDVRVGRKHPAAAIGPTGALLLVWAEGTGWNKGGSVRWQLFAPDGSAMAASAGNAVGLGVWGSPAAFATRDSGFVIVY